MRAHLLLLALASIAVVLALGALPATAENGVVAVNFTIGRGEVNATIYIPVVIPYYSNATAIAPIDVRGCGPSDAVYLDNFTLYIDASLSQSYLYVTELVFYEESTGLPVIGLGLCEALSHEPQPMILLYYKSSIESLLGGGSEAILSLRLGKIVTEDSYGYKTSIEPENTVPDTVTVTIRRAGGAGEAPGPTVTETVTATIVETVTRTVTETVTVQSGHPITTITETVTETYTAPAAATTVTKTVAKTVTETVERTVTRTATETVTMSSGASATTVTVVKAVEKGENQALYTAASATALLIALAAFAIAVKKR